MIFSLYRVKSGSGSWSDWYSLGSQETALRKVSFRTYTSAFSDYDSHTYYIDDLTVVPEPTTLSLLGLGGLLAILYMAVAKPHKPGTTGSRTTGGLSCRVIDPGNRSDDLPRLVQVQEPGQ